MKRAICLFLLLFVTATLSFAQEEIPALPTMDELFAEGVVAEVVTPVVNQQPTRPYTDNEARVVRVFDDDPQTWQEYPYPDEVENFSRLANRLDENTLLLSTTLSLEEAPDPEEQWLLNLLTGEYTRPEILCGQRRSEEGNGRWVVYYEDFPETPAFLCNTETGEMLGPLPTEDYLERQRSILSPNGEWLILFGTFSIYNYHFETGGLILLGTPQLTDFRTAQWIGNDLIFISAANQADMTYPWRNYYLADPAEAESMTPIATIIKPDYLTQLDDPSRYEWIESRGDGCHLAQLNVETAEFNEYDLQELCSQGYRLPDGNGDGDRLFYDIIWSAENYAHWDEVVRLLYLPDALPISSQLVRLNPYTGERTDLYSGEIEWLRDVTPDGQYAVLLVDDSGLLDMIAARKTQEVIDSRPRWIILDTHTGETVYEAPTSWEFDPESYFGLNTWSQQIVLNTVSFNEMEAGMRRLPTSGLFAIGNDRFVHVVLSGEPRNWQRTDTLIQLGEQRVIEQQLTGELALVMPDGRHLVLWSEGTRNSSAVSLYDIETGETTPIIQGEPSRYNYLSDTTVSTEEYSLSMSAASEGNAILVNLCPWVVNRMDCSQSITYRVELGE